MDPPSEDLGLSEAEATERLRRGEGNRPWRGTGRSAIDIVRANVLTRFNAILGVLFVMAVIIGPPQDALFGIVMFANSGIGIVQELRAKRTLAKFRVVSAPTARVVRSGQARTVPLEQVVADDVLEVGAGEQVVVDGTMLSADGLEADESLLTGESRPVRKAAGDELLSGSSVVAGAGRFRATRVGTASYANSLAAEASRFSLVHSHVQDGINRILRWVTWALVPTAVLLFATQLGGSATPDAVRGAIAGVVGMVPDGLVLLTSMALGLGAIRLARRQVLVQQLPAVEVLARVDVVCIDKTGTLTEGSVRVAQLTTLDGVDGDVAPALAALAASDPSPNATLRAIADAYSPEEGWTTDAAVPFSSGRRWSAANFGPRGTWVMGAPELVLGDGQPEATEIVGRYAEQGHRVVAVARTTARLDSDGIHAEELPGDLRPAALVALEQTIRSDAAATVTYFAEQGVTIKVLSGDHPRTVGAVAERVGIAPAAEALDARDLPQEGPGLAELAEQRHVFGRVSPDRKKAIINALQGGGHVVAMVGDGVNDTSALKEADIAVGMGSGTPAARAVSELVLLDDAFSSLPEVVQEGRRVMGNVERVANIFLTKTVYALLLALAIGVATFPFPFLPRQLTLISAVTIGIPAFLLAFSHRAPRARLGFVARVLRFAVPAGVCAACATFISYAFARVAPDVNLDEARTTATMVLVTIGLALVARLASPLTLPRRALIASLAAAYLVILVVPATSDVFALNVPPPIVIVAALGSASIAMWVFEAAMRYQDARCPPGERGAEPEG
jgi:cation-transporting ATPase E